MREQRPRRPRARAPDRPRSCSTTVPISGSFDAQPQQRVVQLAERAQRPELIAGRPGSRPASTRPALGRAHGERRDALRRDRTSTRHRRVVARVGGHGRRSAGSSATPAPVPGRSDDAASSCARAATDSLNWLVGIHGVDQPPLDRALALDALGQRAEHVGADRGGRLRLSTTRVRPPVPGSTPSSGVSGRLTAEFASSTSDDLVAGQRQLVAAAGADAVERREELDARVRARVLHAPGASRS